MSGSRPSESVSVVIAAYNAAQWISETLRSIVTQTFRPSEILVVDDGSTDNLFDVVQTFSEGIHYIRQEHKGQPAARNLGIRAAKGDFIGFCDADDLWHPRKLEAQVGLARSQDFAWIICDADWIDYDGARAEAMMPPLRRGDVLEPLFMQNFIKSATPLVRRGVFSEIGYFDEAPEARIGEDWDMWLRIAARYPLGVVDEKLTVIRLHSDSLIARTSTVERVEGLERVVERAAGREPERLAPLKNYALANISHSAGVQSIREKRFRDAQVYFRRELRHRPWNLETLAYLIVCALGPKVAAPAMRFWRRLR